MPVGKYEKKKEACPKCGKITYLPLHSKYCKGDENGKPEEMETGTEERTATEEAISGDFDILDSDDSLHPKLDQSPLGAAKDKLSRIGNGFKKVIDKTPVMNQQEFRELIKLSDDLFDFLGMDYLKFTDDELDKIVPDMYYLLKKYFPELLQYLKNDFVRLFRLIINILRIFRAKYIAHKMDQFKNDPNKLAEEMAKLTNSPEMEPVRKMAEGIGLNLQKLKDVAKEAADNGKLPSQKKEKKKDAKPDRTEGGLFVHPNY